MSSKANFLLTLAVSAILTAGTGYALNLPKVPGAPTPAPTQATAPAAGAPAPTGASVTRDAQIALVSFASSQLGLAKALGGYDELAAQQQLIEGLKAGDVAATKDTLATAVTVSKAANDAINQKVAENTKLSAENRKLVASSTVEYVRGLVASRNLIASVQGLARNPVALGADASNILYLGKQLPSIVTSGTSTTASLFKYLSANGVDTSAATAAAKDLGT
jgi:hypothetical protein